MKTDELFYELFKLDPQSLFRLVRLELEGEYTFESLTVKRTEKRFDGFCKRTDSAGPNIFLEIQGYGDPTIYWRLFREIFTYYEMTATTAPFIAIVLFLDEKYDPGACPVACCPPHQLIQANVPACLNAVWDHAGVLTVLKPLVVQRKQDIFDEIQQWRADILALHLPEHRFNLMIELLEYLILQRFPTIDLQEVTRMLYLTPLEDTKAVRQLMERAQTKGELIGEIRQAQRLLQRPVSTRASLTKKSVKALKAILSKLEPELYERAGGSTDVAAKVSIS